MKALILVSLLTVSAGNASAEQSLNFEQLRDACQNPAKYHSQVQPTDIKVDCSDRQLTWVPIVHDSVSLAASRVIAHAVSSDKYSVPSTKSPIDMPAIPASCPVLKQFEETLGVSQSLTCAQLLAFDGTATDLCAKMIDQIRGDNPTAIIRKSTGKIVHLCQSPGTDDRGQREPEDDRGQRGQRGQR
jgi:hypothetical protein